ncbi:MAG TPA: hypothetical protein VG518_01925 [Solirubrobacterales bacterium]|nr:hypothetical protein [Solirubrobacterales bacterium]
MLLAALALAACGSGESDEEKIVDVIETASTSTDPASCTEFLTQTFVDQVETGEGAAAVKECEEDAADGSGNPDSVDVAEVEVDGSNATADVTFHGGDLGGQALTLALAKEDGDWKLDEIQRFVKFDRAKIDASFEEALESAEGIDTECILEGLSEYSDGELEEAILGSELEELIEVAANECE